MHYSHTNIGSGWELYQNRQIHLNGISILEFTFTKY